MTREHIVAAAQQAIALNRTAEQIVHQMYPELREADGLNNRIKEVEGEMEHLMSQRPGNYEEGRVAA